MNGSAPIRISLWERRLPFRRRRRLRIRFTGQRRFERSRDALRDAIRIVALATLRDERAYAPRDASLEATGDEGPDAMLEGIAPLAREFARVRQMIGMPCDRGPTAR